MNEEIEVNKKFNPESRRFEDCDGWINIKDQLPPECTRENVNSIFIATLYSHYKSKIFIEPLHYIGGEWFNMFDEEPLDMEYEVTHWRKLPSPPKDK